MLDKGGDGLITAEDLCEASPTSAALDPREATSCAEIQRAGVWCLSVHPAKKLGPVRLRVSRSRSSERTRRSRPRNVSGGEWLSGRQCLFTAQAFRWSLNRLFPRCEMCPRLQDFEGFLTTSA